MRRRAVTGWLIGLAVLAVGAVAVVDAVVGQDGATPAREAERVRAPEIRGPDVPVPGALPGTLYVATGTGCRLRALDLATLSLGQPGPQTACGIWPAPAGGRAVVNRKAGTEGRDLWLAELGDPARLGRRLGPARSAPSWSSDGRRVAWCRADGTSAALDVARGAISTYPGCFPVILGDGTVVTRKRDGRVTTVYADGTRLLGQAELARGFAAAGPGTGMPRVLGEGAGPDGTLALVVFRPTYGFSAASVLQLWAGAELEAAFPLAPAYGPAVTFFGLRVEFSPDGTEVALVYPESTARPVADDLVALLDVRSRRPVEGATELRYGGHAWSPDGQWLALSTGDEIRVYGAVRDDPAYILPVAASAIAWEGE